MHQRDPVHSRHAVVSDEAVEGAKLSLLRLRDTLDGVLEGRHLIAPFRERQLRDLEGHGVVVHNEDSGIALSGLHG